jgi:cell division protein FtsQ
MHQRISRKIFAYFFILLLLVTTNNINLSKFNILKINNFKILGLNNLEKEQLQKNIKEFKNKNLFFLDKKKISNKIFSNKAVEEFHIFKNYPSNLEINIKKTNFLAITKKDKKYYYMGSNGNLIKTDNPQINLPFVSGNVDIKDFLQFKTIIDNSSLDFNNIKSLNYLKSRRWDLETKDGLIIQLPLKEIEFALDILSKISKKEEFKKIKVIDLRQNNQVIINE